MVQISTADKIKKNFDAQEQGFQKYFVLLKELLEKISSPEPALAYCFQRIEFAQRNGLYALLMREYRTDSDLSWQVVDRLDVTRISGKRLPSNLKLIIQPAESVRDDITHGRTKSKAEINKAILNCIEYAEALNAAFNNQVGFKPIGDLRGVTSKRGKPQLDKKISRVVLKGLGFLLS